MFKYHEINVEILFIYYLIHPYIVNTNVKNKSIVLLIPIILERTVYFVLDIMVMNGTFPSPLGCVNLSFAYVEGESLLMALKDVALSSGRLVITQIIMKIFKYELCFTLC